MNADAAIWVIVGAVLVIGAVIVVLIREHRDPLDDGPLGMLASASTPRIQRREDAPREVRLIYTHAAPPRHFTVEEAWPVMQDHRDCRIDKCPRKRAAYDTLVAAHKIVPRGTHAGRRRAHVG